MAAFLAASRSQIGTGPGGPSDISTLLEVLRHCDAHSDALACLNGYRGR
jgi:hypothetical protein